ncbi:MAG TPA: amino acid carrier protein, partial [Myxococcota bacterium]|nr:amino acid carrier protein [Myxococcota bacterium]
MVDLIKEGITIGLIFPIIVIAGTYLSIRLRFIQLTKLFTAVRLITLREGAGSMSSFGALSAILGGNLGTGNISGVAVALVTGGPGSLLWMWVMAILASITKYVGCYLGVHYQRQNKALDWVGGPMFYLKEGLRSKFLAGLFCILTISSALTVGNLVQVHALTLPLKDFDINPLFFGIILAVLVGGVIFGGLKRFAHVVSVLVPVMAVAYIMTCLIILVLFHNKLMPSVLLIIKSAFDFAPVAGGFLGYGVLIAIRAGFDRGLFATDSGLGLAPIVHAAVRDTRPHHDNRVTQGLISLLSPMIVMVVCTMTGLVLLATGAYEKMHLASTIMC